MLGKYIGLLIVACIYISPLFSKIDLKDYFDSATPTGSMLRLVSATDCNDAVERKVNMYTRSRLTGGLFCEPHVCYIFTQIAQQELLLSSCRETRSDNVVVYHAQSSLITFLQDLVTVLLDVFCHKKLKNIVPLRVTSELFVKHKDVFSLVDFFEEEHFVDQAWIDDKKLARDVLISVNPTLISNIALERLGDCTLDYFATPRLPRALRLGGVKEIARNMLAHFGVHELSATLEALLEEIVDDKPHVLSSIIQKHEGWIVQIFVPKEHAKRCLYCALPMGRAVRSPTGDVLTGAILSDSLQLTQINGAYNKAITFYDHLLALQLRLYPHPDVFLNDDSGVKMFRYSRYAKDQKDLDAYWAVLYGIVQTLKTHES